jgi:hypothetical protein
MQITSDIDMFGSFPGSLGLGQPQDYRSEGADAIMESDWIQKLPSLATALEGCMS